MTIFFAAIAVFVALLGFVVLFGAPYVPSRPKDLRRAFEQLYAFGSNDVLVDLGSGDGIVLREASRRGARAIGYEINPFLVYISRFLSRRDNRVEVRRANIWKVRLPDDVSVVYIFGESRDIKKLLRLVQSEATRLNRRLVVISYGFKFPDIKPAKKVGAHFMYSISPLQPE